MMNKSRQPLGCRQCVSRQDEKCARDLSRAARPENKVDICENGKEHEWVETGGSIEHSANHLSVLYFTHYKCKHCAATKSVLDEVQDH